MARPISFDPDSVLDEAMSLFWTRGYHRVSVEDIVQNTGLNRHSLYTRFGSKFGLLKAVLDRYEEAVLTRVRAILSAGGSTRERLAELLSLRGSTPRNGHAVRESNGRAYEAHAEAPAMLVERHETLAACEHADDELDFWDDVRRRGCLAMRLAAELRDTHVELAQDVSHFGSELESLVTSVLRQGQDRGEVRRDRDPQDLASVLVGGFLLPVVYAPAAQRTEAFLCVLD